MQGCKAAFGGAKDGGRPTIVFKEGKLTEGLPSGQFSHSLEPGQSDGRPRVGVQHLVDILMNFGLIRRNGFVKGLQHILTIELLTLFNIYFKPLKLFEKHLLDPVALAHFIPVDVIVKANDEAQ